MVKEPSLAILPLINGTVGWLHTLTLSLVYSEKSLRRRRSWCIPAPSFMVFVSWEKYILFRPVLKPHWFQCGSGSSFLSQCGPDPDQGSQTNADPCGSGSWPDFEVKTGEFLKYNILKIGNRSKTPYEGTKPFGKQETRLSVNFGQLPCTWIRIRIPNADPDPDPEPQNQCGSMWIRIHNTGLYEQELLFISMRSGSGPREPNQCWSMRIRIRILARLWSKNRWILNI